MTDAEKTPEWLKKCITCRYAHKKKDDADYFYCRLKTGECKYEPYKKAKKETELKPIGVDARGCTNVFECQTCKAVIYSGIYLKEKELDYEFCPYCGRKIKD